MREVRKQVSVEAHRGTLFRHEVGEPPKVLQAKLLRALETREVRRVGSNAPVQVDVRIVAATNARLEQRVNEGSFREDLYCRLAVVEVELPPRRDRRGDIEILARHFARELGGETNLVPGFLAGLKQRQWPGNVRELRNHVQRALTFGALGFVGAGTLRESVAAVDTELDRPLKEARDAGLRRFEEQYVHALLRRADHNVTHAASLAGVSRRFLQRTLARLGIDRSQLGGWTEE